MSNITRIVRSLKREIFRHHLPHGLVSWRYLLPNSGTRIRLHRQFWWQGRSHWPRLLWLGLEVWLWLRWVSFGAWLSTWRVVSRLGLETRRNEGLPVSTQAWRVLGLALGWCIHPRDVYRFRLYRNPEAALDYVFDQELGGYHDWRSLPFGLDKDSLALLQDKWRQTEELALQGVPMAPILACVPHQGKTNLTQWLVQEAHVFCKTRSGNQGIGAFEVWHTHTGNFGRMFDGRRLDNNEEVENAWHELLALDDALVQPCLQNHSVLAPLGVGDEAITVRFISQWLQGELTCLCATIELPASIGEKTKHPFYVILPLDSATGQILTLPKEKLPPLAQTHYSRVQKQLTQGLAVPHWQALIEGSFQAHGRFPDICAIAWDWVITPQGPLLLEGNAGWGASTPQIINGGLLSRYN